MVRSADAMVDAFMRTSLCVVPSMVFRLTRIRRHGTIQAGCGASSLGQSLRARCRINHAFRGFTAYLATLWDAGNACSGNGILEAQPGWGEVNDQVVSE
jgi:hypothetical protein